MAKIRIYELARDLNMTNKALLEKLRNMDISVKSHMSGVDEEAIPGIKEALFGNTSEVVTEKRVKSTVIRRRKKVVEKKLEVAEVPPVAEAEPETPEVKPVEIVPPLSEEVVEDEVAEVDVPDQSAEEVGLETPVEVAPEPLEEPEKAKPAKKAKAKKKPKGKKERPARPKNRKLIFIMSE